MRIYFSIYSVFYVYPSLPLRPRKLFIKFSLFFLVVSKIILIFTPDSCNPRFRVTDRRVLSMHQDEGLSTPSRVRRCRHNKAGIGWEQRESLHIDKGVYSTLHRYNPNFEHLEIHVADVAMVDVPGMCLYASPFEKVKLYSSTYNSQGELYSYSAWASKLLI